MANDLILPKYDCTTSYIVKSFIKQQNFTNQRVQSVVRTHKNAIKLYRYILRLRLVSWHNLDQLFFTNTHTTSKDTPQQTPKAQEWTQLNKFAFHSRVTDLINKTPPNFKNMDYLSVALSDCRCFSWRKQTTRIDCILLFVLENEISNLFFG